MRMCARVRRDWVSACAKRGQGDEAMIGRLRGTIIHKQPPWLVVDVHGVGYELEAPMSTFYDLPDVGKDVVLFTHYAQKEDSVAFTASSPKANGACSVTCNVSAASARRSRWRCCRA